MIIQRPTEEEFLSILRCLLRHQDEREREKALQQWRQQEWEAVLQNRSDLFSGLFVARTGRDQPALWAQWSHRLPGASAVIGPITDLHADKAGTALAAADVEAALLNRTVQWLKESCVQMAQVVLEEAATVERWHSFGFQHLVQLIYVLWEENTQASLGAVPNAKDSAITRQPSGYQWNVVCPTQSPARWQAILDATFQQTMDCPALNGRRRLEDTLRGYQHTATYRADGWWILSALDPKPVERTQDLGCVILADHPESEMLELVYFGLVATARGRKIGGSILEKIQDFCRRNSRQKLIAAVDSQNLPALKLYHQHGFKAIAERTVWAWFSQPEKMDGRIV